MPNTNGYLQEINTLTQAIEPILKQNNYEVPNIPDFVDFDFTGAYMDRIIQGRTRSHSKRGAGFRSGSPGFAKAPHVEVSRDTISINNYPWLEYILWSKYELEQAKRGIISFDTLSERVDAVKKSWDLDKQDAIFCGFKEGNIEIFGLLNIPNVNSNNSLIPNGKGIKNLSATEMHNFIAEILDAYAKNSRIATMPDRFVVPLADYLGWGNTLVASPDLNNVNVIQKSIVEYLEDMFKTMTQNPSFKILFSKYSEASIMKEITGIELNRYALYKKERESLRFVIPQELTTSNIVETSPETFSMAASGQLAGIICGRPENILYLDTAEA